MRKNLFVTLAVLTGLAIALSACRLGADIETLRYKAAVAAVNDSGTGGDTISPPPVATVKVTVETVYVFGGSFQMGNPDTSVGLVDERPVHTVTLAGFYMGKYPVTQTQYQAVMGSNPSWFHGRTGREPAYGEVQGNRPAEQVSWYDALVFCNKLSTNNKLTPAYRISGSTNPSAWGAVPTSSNSAWNSATIVAGPTGYRLPTEAQWEYAAKGGNPSAPNWVGYTYSGSNTVDGVAWYSGNSDSKTHETGRKQPNGLGLYDMSGNVREWCWDWYGSYSSGAQTNPSGSVSGDNRVPRGGGWPYSAEYARSAARYGSFPYGKNQYVGFRVVLPQ